MKAEIQTPAPAKPWHCPMCDRTYTKQPGLASHIAKEHTDGDMKAAWAKARQVTKHETPRTSPAQEPAAIAEEPEPAPPQKTGTDNESWGSFFKRILRDDDLP